MLIKNGNVDVRMLEKHAKHMGEFTFNSHRVIDIKKMKNSPEEDFKTRVLGEFV